METNFEYILLKKLIMSGEYFGKVVPILESQYFQEIGNQELFKLIQVHYNDYKIIPSLTELVASVKNVPNEEIRSSIIGELQKINTVDEVENIEFMLDETVSWVRDALYYESLILGSDGMKLKDEDMKRKAKALMEKMSQISLDTDLGLDFADIEEMIAYYQEKLLGVKTQHAQFNKRLGAGFLPGTLSIIMAASGIGKSLLMTDLVSGQIKEGKNILLISMEMIDKEIMKRVHANAMDLEINKLRMMSPDVIRIAHAEAQKAGAGTFFVKDYPNGAFSAIMLEQLLDSFKVEKGIEFDIIYLDYLGIMKSDLISPSAGLYSYVKSIVEEVRAVAKTAYNGKMVPIVSASQLNRSAVNNTDASNDSVSDSIGTVQTADFIIFLLQNEQMKAEKIITCKVTKNRFTGYTDTWDMNVDYEHMRFTDALVTGEGMSDDEVKQTIMDIRKADMDIIKAQGMSEDDGFGDMNSSEPGFDIYKELGLEV